MSEQKLMLSRGWIVTFAGTAINIIIGVFYAWAVIGKELVVQWNWTATEAVLPFAAGAVFFSIGLLVAGRVQDLIGPRAVALTGALMLGTGWVLCSLSRNPTFISLVFGILCTAGTGMCLSVTVPSALKWFSPNKKGLISGIVLSGLGLSAVFMSPLIKFLIDEWGIQNAMRILGISSWGIITALSMQLRIPPAGYQPDQKPAMAGFASEPLPIPRQDTSAISRGTAISLQREYEWWETLRTPQFYFLWVIVTFSAAPNLMVVSNASLIVRTYRVAFDPVFGPMIIAVLNTVGRLSGGYISDKIGRLMAIVLYSLFQSANMLAFPYYTSSALLFMGLALTGLFFGSFISLVPAATADFFGLKNLGVNYGMINTGISLAGLLGSLAGGKVYDWFGSFDRAFVGFSCILFLTAGLAFLLIRIRHGAKRLS